MTATDAPRKKVLLVVTKGNWGGAQRYVFDMAQGLAARGYDIAVVHGAGDVLPARLATIGIRTIFLPRLGRDIRLTDDLRACNDLVRCCKSERPDIVHLNSSKIGILGAVAARLAGVKKIVFTVHGWPFNETSRNIIWRMGIWVASYLSALLATDLVVIASPEERQAKRMPGISRKTHLIHNGIAAPQLLAKGAARTQLGLPTEAFVVGTIAELHPNKGLLRLVHTAPLVPDAIFCVIGEGEQRPSLEKEIQRLGLEHRFHLVGFKERASSYLSAFDVCILSSKKEGLPYVILEAGAAGIPIIASDVGGVRDILGENDTYCLPTASPEHIAQAIQQIRPTDKKADTDTIRARITKEFSLDRMVTQTIALYERH